MYDSTSTAAESSPDVIRPIDNPISGRWLKAIVGGSVDSISEANTNVTVNDTGSGTVTTTVDGSVILTIDANGATYAATLLPGYIGLCSDAPGTDKTCGRMHFDYIDGGDGAENSKACIEGYKSGSYDLLIL